MYKQFSFFIWLVVLLAVIGGSVYLYFHRKDVVKQNQINWMDVNGVFAQCQIKSIDPGAGSYPYLRFKNGQYKVVIGSPGLPALEKIAENASSTCGPIPVISSVY